MGYVLEKVSEENIKNLNSLGIKNWSGSRIKKFYIGDSWWINKEKKAFLMPLGGGRDSDPYVWLFWWNGFEVRIEISLKPNNEVTRKPLQSINRIVIPQKGFEQKEEILNLISEGFSAENRILTQICCVPEKGEI